MKIKTLLQQCIFILLTSFLFTSCQYDPHANLLTTTEPQEKDITGTYVLDRYNLPDSLSLRNIEIKLELHNDGTFNATNVPPWGFEEPGKDFVSSLQRGIGKWEKSTMGTLDPGSRDIWGIYLRTKVRQFHPANFIGDRPPYGLIFTLGDPDSGNAIILKKIK